jgi:hypothetical protein
MYSWKNKINACKIMSLTFGNHARDKGLGIIQFIVGEIGEFR